MSAPTPTLAPPPSPSRGAPEPEPEPTREDLVAFYQAGTRPSERLGAIEGLGLRPALLARYRDLSTVRHDYPVVLVDDAPVETSVRPLSGLFDDLLAEVATGRGNERLRHHALRLEREIRSRVERGAPGPLSKLWDEAERGLLGDGDTPLADSLAKLRAARRVDGDVIGCDRELPERLLTHVWRTVQAQKARRMREEIERAVRGLADILRADEASSEAGLSPDRLRASVSSAFAPEFDFGAMSRLLTRSRPAAPLPERRRSRIQRLLATLASQRFFAPGTARRGTRPAASQRGVCRSCGEALEAWRERLPGLVALAKAFRVARLEIAGTYREDVHDALFDALGPADLEPSELARFPDYLVCLRADTMKPAEHVRVLELLAAGLPMKVLVQADELAPAPASDGASPRGTDPRLLTGAAMGVGGAYVLQGAGSHLCRMRERIVRGLGAPGPALFGVYSGAGGVSELPPYLASAVAVESRAFPVFAYDTSAGPDWAARFSLADNPQPERDWPLHTFTYEDEALQRAAEQIAFTLVDFLACDTRHAHHFARVPKQDGTGAAVHVAALVSAEPAGMPEPVPYLLMVDPANALHRVLVDRKLIREARRCRERWRSLQELGGIHNSHAERLVAAERRAWEERAQTEADARAAAAAPVTEAPPSAAGAPAVAAPAAALADARRAGEPVIETLRCSTCNECTKINDRMFKYNANKQAYIADPDAGTYAQLVQAAEKCQVAVIHPGKPRNPAEPGLDELLRRAEPFL